MHFYNVAVLAPEPHFTKEDPLAVSILEQLEAVLLPLTHSDVAVFFS